MNNQKIFRLVGFILLLHGYAHATELIFIHLTDTHIVTEWDPDKRQGVSIARAYSRIKKIRKENPDAAIFLAHSGDFVSPSGTSRVHQGSDVVELLNAIGVDVGTLGNHEFDYGPSVLKALLKQVRFPLVVANVSEGEADTPFAELPKYHVIERNGVRVAFIGVVTRHETQNSARKLGDLVSVSDPAEAFEQALLEVKALNPPVDFTVALTHLEYAEDRAVLDRHPLPDLILGGHEHTIREEIHFGVSPYRKGLNHDLQDLRVLHFKKDPRSGAWRRTKEVYELLDREIPEDEAIAEISARHKLVMDAILGEVVGAFPESFDGTWSGLARELEQGESKLATFVATTLAEQFGTELCLFNAGCLSRSNQIYPAGSVTKGTLQQLYPYTDPFVIVDVPGKAIRSVLVRMIQKGFARNDASWFTAMPALGKSQMRWSRAGNKNSDLKVTVQGEPLRDNRVYRLAVNRFLFESDEAFKKASTLVLRPEEALPEFESLVEGIRTRFPCSELMSAEGSPPTNG